MKTHVLNFNSTMVRLKQKYVIDENTCIKFQFHYGSIEAGINYNGKNTLLEISIPLWFD